MEKDFFVCWLLSILFESEFADSLVFKGGTSLSKIFGATNRFSEDIDFRCPPPFLDFLKPLQIAVKLTNGGKKLET
jgi:predicted nucleotidyltransferase component of viral defense system